MAADLRRLTKRRSLRCCVATVGLVVASVGMQASGALAATGWTLVNGPDPSSTYSVLGSAACTGPRDCWAVGYYFNGSVYRTLTEHYSSGVWRIVSSPNTSRTRTNQLNSVTCLNASDCWAAGVTSNSSGGQAKTLVEHYDGSHWVIVASADPSTSDNELSGVACVDASTCWAVGTFYDGTQYQTLIERSGSA